MYDNFGGQQSPSKGICFTFLTPSDQSNFEQLFSQCAIPFGGDKVGAQAVSDLLKRSNLDNASLAKIWDLSCISNASLMTFPEFALAMYLTSRKLIGQELPSALPPSIREEVQSAMITATPIQVPLHQSTYQLTNANIQQPSLVNSQLPMTTGTVPQMSINPGYTSNGVASFQSPKQTNFNPAPYSQISHLQSNDFAKNMMPNQSGVMNVPKVNSGASGNNQLSWKISPQDEQRYREIFIVWERSGSGFMSGKTAKAVLTQSQLPPESLSKIWNLVDSKNRGSLDVDEFCIAMHLVYKKLNGFEIPTVLPSELASPSGTLKELVLSYHSPSLSGPQHHVVEMSNDQLHNGQKSYTMQTKDRKPISSSEYGQYTDNESNSMILERLRYQICQERLVLEHIDVPRTKSHNPLSNKLTIDELQGKIKKLHVEHVQLLQDNPLAIKYSEDSEILLNLMTTQKALQSEIQYLYDRDIPILASQLRSTAAELKNVKVHHSKKNERTPDYLGFIHPTGPGGSVTESDRVRAKAKAMMAARNIGGFGTSVNSGYALRRAEEEKQEANRIADVVEQEVEYSRNNLLDMRGDLRYLEEVTAYLDDKKRFEISRQDLSYELRQFIEDLEPMNSSHVSYSANNLTDSFSSLSVDCSPTLIPPTTDIKTKQVPKPTSARPRTTEEIKREAELRVKERLATLQAKKSPRNLPREDGSIVYVSKPDDAEISPEERIRMEKEDEERNRKEEKDFEERKKKRLQKEEADRRARYEAIQRAEEEEEERKKAQQSETSLQKPSPENNVGISNSKPVDSTSPLATVTLPESDPQQLGKVTNKANPFAKSQSSSQNQPSDSFPTEKQKKTTDKRTSYNPFASFSAFSATKAGSNNSNEDEDDWSDNDYDDFEDEDEFPAAGSARNMAGKLSSILNQMHGASTSAPSPSLSNSPASSLIVTVNATQSEQSPPLPPLPPPAPTTPTFPSTPSSTPLPIEESRNALLGQIQLGKKLKKTITNDRSSSSIAGRILN